MKNLLPLFGLILSTFQINAQDKFSQDFQSVRSELTKWDPVRGEWLASSLEAMSKNEPVPVRTFPENFTPLEMMRMVPANHRTAIQQTVTNNQRNAAGTESVDQWNTVAAVIDRTNCKPIMGRSYGDPHLVSFDGASYSFQTVGEFVMARSASGNMEVQSRQQPQSDDFSLNTAIAMNVSGDRVCIYANEKPDNISTTALRVNGSPVTLSREVYFLPHGGTIKYTQGTYLVTWPTGETANVELRNSARMSFLNVSLQVFPCSQDSYEGLLGNANGRESDDFDTQGGMNRPMYMAFSSFGNDNLERASNEAEKEYLAFLAKDFARMWRVTPETTLFDYGPGLSTLSYTDESFPRVHRTIGDLNGDRQTAARRACEEEGIRGPELKGCIYDRAYLDIPASPRPVIADPTEGLVMGKIERPMRNDNSGLTVDRDAIKDKGDGASTPQAQPLQKPTDREAEKKPEDNTGKVITPKESDNQPTNSGGTINGTKVIKTSPKPKGTTPKPSGSTPVKNTPAIKPGKG